MTDYQRVEKELRKYKGLKIFIENAKQQLELIKGDYRGMGCIVTDQEPTQPTNDFYSTVESEVLIRNEDIDYWTSRIIQAQALIDRVDRALQMLNEAELKIITMSYFEHQPWFRIAYAVSISERHCKRMRTDAIKRMTTTYFGD